MLAGTVLVNSTSTGGSSSQHSLQATLLSAIPYLCAAIGMWWIANSSHRFREKDFHIGIPWVSERPQSGLLGRSVWVGLGVWVGVRTQ
jgi:hypothetical protein